MLVGNQVVNIAATFVATVWSIRLFGERNVSLPMFLFTLTLILVGSIFPKAFALGFAEGFSRLMAYPLYAFVTVMRPVTWTFHKLIDGVAKLFKVKAKQFTSVNEQEIESLIEIGAEEGAIEEGVDVFLKHVLKFGETKVEDLMIHLKDIVAVDLNTTRDELLEFLSQHESSQFPVYDNDFNNTKGIISLHELLRILKDTKNKFPLKNRPLSHMVVVPKTASLIELFKVLSEKNRQMAMVTDEFGQIVGLVTLSDIMELITGVRGVSEKKLPEIKKIDRNEWEADGETKIDQINEALNIKLPYPEQKVINLVILEELKRFPEADELVMLDGIVVQVKRIEKNMIKKLSIHKRHKMKEKKAT